MKKTLSIFCLVISLAACNNKVDQGKMTLNGNTKNFTSSKVFLEQLHFDGTQAELKDSAVISNGSFSIGTRSAQEGFFRLRFNDMEQGFLFIGDAATIQFTADAKQLNLEGPSFSSPANASLKQFIKYNDSLGKQLQLEANALNQMQQQSVAPTDSAFIAAQSNFNSLKEGLAKYCLQYSDTTKSPVLALFTCTAAPVGMEGFEIPMNKLVKRFPDNKDIAMALAFLKKVMSKDLQKPTAESGPSGQVSIGSMAPDITMNDVNDQPFSLSSLRSKFVLVDFWASWCSPCRMENPNVVAAYNKYKDKNFTVLGVSLDKNKEAWLNAIQEDKLNWYHISDLKFWNSAAVGLYGFDGIPFNVLVNPEGKIIATGLRGDDLLNKLEEVLK
ncbi:MAG: TlpA disulfide reductase family protein [Chitinophagaceae bacterium]